MTQYFPCYAGIMGKHSHRPLMKFSDVDQMTFKVEITEERLVFLFNVDDDGNNQWPEVLKFLFDSVNAENVGLREAALHIFW